MAKVHFWQFLIDDEGRPIEGADIYVYLAASNEAAYIYMDEIAGAPSNKLPQLKTNSEGFFEFWVGDSSEVNGYESTQKFKLYWERIGIASGKIDYVDIFQPTLPVDETDDNTEKNKSVSNKLAKSWEEHRLNTGHVVHGIQEYDSDADDTKRNKLISNNLGNKWQTHRLFSFNTHVNPPSDELDIPEWEDPESEYYGAHGLQQIKVSGDNASDTVFNKLLNNALGNKWDEHVNFNFETDTEGTEGFTGTAHGLQPVDFGPLSVPIEDATPDQIKEYDTYNKLVSNRLIRSLLETLTQKSQIFAKQIPKMDWSPSIYTDGIYYHTLVHGLETENISVNFWRKQTRRQENGAEIENKALFTPADVFILDENQILIHVTELIDLDVVINGQTNKIIGLE